MEEWIWPILEDMQSSERVARFAALWAGIIGVFSLIAGVLSGHYAIAAILGVLYATAAWRTARWSFGWSVTGFVLCVLQTIIAVIALPLLWSIIMPFAVLALMNGVRATIALRRFSEQKAAV
jgi:hypothetical protein